MKNINLPKLRQQPLNNTNLFIIAPLLIRKTTYFFISVLYLASKIIPNKAFTRKIIQAIGMLLFFMVATAIMILTFIYALDIEAKNQEIVLEKYQSYLKIKQHQDAKNEE